MSSNQRREEYHIDPDALFEDMGEDEAKSLGYINGKYHGDTERLIDSMVDRVRKVEGQNLPSNYYE